MRKKALLFCAAALIALSMTACGDGTAQKKDTEAETDAVEAETTVADTEAEETDDTEAAADDESEDADTTEGGGAAAAGSYADGTYTAEAVGASEAGSGTVTVTVTIAGGKIEDVDIEAPKDAASLGAQAIKKLPDAIKEAQSADVDKVTGASHTSEAIITAVADCLEQASK